MRREGMPGFARLCGGVLLGALLAGCGAGPEDGSPGAVEWTRGEAVADVVDGSGSGPRALDVDLDDYVPADLARFGPAVAYGGGKFFAAWHDVRDGGVYGTRVKPDGTVLDPDGIRLNPEAGFGGRPVIAYNGEYFFVVWESGDGVDGVRVRPDGTVVGPVFSVIFASEASGPVGIACSDMLCMVSTAILGDDESVIYFGRVTRDGVVLEAPDPSVSPGFNFGREPSVAWNNSRREFLIVWSDSRGGVGTEDIYGNRVREDGTILDGTGFPISTAAGAQLSPDVTWSGRRFQAVWSDSRGGDADIYGARVRPGGTVEDPLGIPISTAAGDQTTPRIAHHNSKSLVVWADTRGGTHRIWGARLGEYGDVWDPAGLPISGGEYSSAEFMPDVAYGNDRFFVAYAVGDVDDPLEPHLILGKRVNHQGQVKDVPGLTLTLEPR